MENWIGIVRETEAVWRAEEKKEQENLVGYLIVFAAAFDAIMNEQYPEGKYGSARNLLQRYGEDEYCRPWFCKMAGRKQTKEIFHGVFVQIRLSRNVRVIAVEAA